MVRAMSKARCDHLLAPLVRDHGAEVDALAKRALSLTAQRRSAAQAAHRSAHFRDLFDASIASDDGLVRQHVRQILRLGVPPETVTDIYIPEVARRLGAAWVSDRLSFVEVSIGTARLQAIARSLASEPEPDRRGGCRIAVVVPSNEEHTLGAVVLTAQLRRMGIKVILHLGDPHECVAESLGADRPDAVMISAAHQHCIRNIAELVQTSRRALGSRTRVLVGGPILELEGLDVLGETYADDAISDPGEALAACDLVPTSGRIARARELVR
jgi:methylmalonyl-CoA mutase cobalamin-binding subunit